ncbi:MAG: outer membrane protein assembly factor BamB [Propionivibrio sp.]
MRKFLLAALLSSGLACSLTGCSTLEWLNPFADSGPKMAELQPIDTTLAAHVAWQQSVGKSGVYSFTPAVLGNTVYAAGGNGDVIRIDDGRQTWKINAGQPLSGGVGADGTMVVVGSPKGDLLAFSSADGTPLWKVKASSEILSPPVLGDGLVVVRSGDNRLSAYDATDGTRKWFFQRPTPALSLRVSARPLIDGKYVFAGFPGGKLIAVSTSNGAAVWDGTVALPKGTTELDRVADITSAPVISGRSVCAVAFQGRVACFDLGNGNLVWARDMSSAVGLDIDSRFLYVSDDKGAVHALDMASGASIWKQDKLSLRRLTAPVARRGYIAVADVQGVVHFLSREDGSFVARLTTDGSPVVAPLQKLGNGVLVQTSKGGIYAIEAE